MSCSCQNDKSSIETTPNKKIEAPSQKAEYARAIVSFVMLVAGIIAAETGAAWFADQRLRFIYYLAAYLPVAIPVYSEAWEAIRKKDLFSEFALMSIATVGAFLINEYPEAVAVMLFYSVGELFQDNAVHRAKKNIGALLDIRPETAVVVLNGKEETLPPQSIQPGEIIEVKPGGRVPLDGILDSDSVSVNTAALTGESVPRSIRRGDEILAGMIVADSVARIIVTKPFGESALSRILELVQNATERKAPTEQFIRKFARIYTPIVVGLAAMIVVFPWLYSLVLPAFAFDLEAWVYRALVFLVISCPCALVISIPLGYFGGIGAASRQGILFKGSNYLDAITKVNTVVMDKTGTLTKGVFDVQEIVTADGAIENELIGLLAAAESKSTHPIAKAIMSRAEKAHIEIAEPQSVKEVAGHGLEASIDGKLVLAGNSKLLDSRKITYPVEISRIAETVVLCAVNGKYAGYVSVADEPKPDAAKAVKLLLDLGIKRIIMLSGDKQDLVSELAKKLHIAEAYGDLLPEGKAKHIERLKNDPATNVAFVGDGINDAPVLALSDVGIAMGGLGSDMAIETADVIIQTDEPAKIATAIKIGEATRKIVTQNIVLAFTIKLIVLTLGAAGLASLWEAVFADVGTALIAIFNAIRILRMKF
ncbi:MAG: cadmium-translocating P-type ATPase [Dysgonamonadaceae bacterium]|jgi:Cd2+/Zn2+-exporting ATPase|nr:cadmium-translocating P-type ATPase [Dysgonamonadaceae bacterium]